MLSKILIANRGEIAVRIARACAELGVRSVAIYADADRFGLHVKKADEAYPLGAAPVAGYLNPQRIADLAAEAGCDAVHPGYGFLSESPALAEACAARGLRFIGPSVALLRRMGDKTEARQSMIQAGVPVIPGSEGNVRDATEAAALAGEIGYPVMLKATSGGGGRGIRRCDSEQELRRNFPRVISEATKAFGSADVFLEKCIVNPRHIEVQVLGDSHGNVIHLFERDCSIQRRNQKLIEIAPSPQLSQQQQHEVGTLAVTAARAVGYENAGTVEFLLTQEGTFHFMEMNTRLQVEHSISEQITGVDIVQEQIRIASGLPLRYRQKDIERWGFAIEFRINAEDPKNGFLPSYGHITRYYSPGGPGVRTDAAIYTGYEFPPYYDSLCAKLIVWGLDWEQVMARSQRALRDIGIYGIRTTIPYYMEVLKTPAFRDRCFDTGFVAAHPDLVRYSTRRRPWQIAAAVAAALGAHTGL
jgi:pyruvate carboxylase subunit A